MPIVASVTKDPTGFLNRTDSILSFDDGTRTFSIAPVSASYDIYYQGVKHTISTTKTIVIPDTEGLYFIYFDNTATLQYITGFDISLITEHVYAANIYWDADNNSCIFIGDERHGLMMDNATHQYLHQAHGSAYITGFALENFSIDGDGSSNTHAQFSCGSGTFNDEDIQFQFSSTSSIPIFYRSGTSGKWRKKTADTYPVLYTGTAGYSGANNRLAFNEFALGIWSLTEVSLNNYYALTHFFACNDTTHKIIGVVGTNEYTSLNDARVGATTELISLSGLPFQEFIPIGAVIFQTSSAFANVPKAVVVSTDTGTSFVDFRKSNGYKINGFAGSHNLLSDLEQDDHLQYLNITRGDARYYTESEVDTLISNTEAYADNLVVGLLDDRGNFDASVNLFPSAGGSGTAGAILKGDLWTISVAGNVGGHIVTAGDILRALVDTPGQTDGNWAITENNLGYVAENSTNKSSNVNTDQASTIKYPTVKSVFDWATGLFQTLLNKDASGGYAGLTLFKINFKNAANTFTSFFTNINTAARTYTFQDKDGTIADIADVNAKVADAINDGITTIAPSQNVVFDALALKEVSANKNASSGYVGLSTFDIQFKNTAGTFTSLFTNANTAIRTYTFPNTTGTIALTSDIPSSILTTKGDLLGFSTLAARVPAGSNGQKLISDSTQALGVKYENKSYFSIGTDLATNIGNSRSRNIAAAGSYRFTFDIPNDFHAWVSLVLLIIPRATVAAANIDLTSDYASIGELYTANTETNTSATYNLTVNQLFGIALTTVLTGAVAGDRVGILVSNTGVTSGYDTVGIKGEYR